MRVRTWLFRCGQGERVVGGGMGDVCCAMCGSGSRKWKWGIEWNCGMCGSGCSKVKWGIEGEGVERMNKSR